MQVDRNKVYVAGPYSLGDVAMNVRAAILTGNLLIEVGYIPFIPHLSHFWHVITPKPYHEWLEYDKCWLPFCDYVCRVPGQSFGADGECLLAQQLGIPVHPIEYFVEHKMLHKPI